MRAGPTASPTVTAEPPPLMRATVPQLPSRLVRRERLERRVDQAVASGLVVVSAPAGSGKTLLLTGWAARRVQPVAWLSVEREDADPHRFWADVLEALRNAGGMTEESLLATLQPPPVPDERFLDLLVHACDELPGLQILVLDDMHVLAGTAAMESLANAVRRGLGNLRLVVSTRSDPVLPLQRLRLAGGLTEIRGGDLEFTEEETVRLLAQDDLRLPQDQLATLLGKTEGWAAGLRLAALSLQAASDVGDAVAHIAGDQRTFADYFLQEVLEGLGPELTSFLLDTSITRRLSGDLADALTGGSDGHRLLSELERRNLFVIALDDRRAWYRYHQLFADLLRHRLKHEDPDRYRDLHARAAAWFADRGDGLEAARHLRRAEAWVELSRYVLRHAGPLMMTMARPALVEVLAEMPPALAAQEPEAAAAAAIAAYARGDRDVVSRHIARSRQVIARVDDEEARVVEATLVTLESILAWRQGDPAAQVRLAVEAGQRWATCESADVVAVTEYRAGVELVRAVGLLWAGELSEAETVLRSLLRALVGRAELTPGHAVYLHGSLGALAAMTGRLREATEETDVALAVAEASGWSLLHRSASALLGRAVVALLRDDRELCRATIAEARQSIAGFPDRYTEAALTLLDGRLDVVEGDPDAALRKVAALEAEWELPPFLAGWARLVEAEALVAAGEPERVASVLQRVAATPRSRPGPHRAVLQARAEVAANRPAAALVLLDRLNGVRPVDLVPQVDALLVRALVHDRLRQDADAYACLSRAVDIAAPEGIVRPFVLAGGRVRPLLEVLSRVTGDHRDFLAAVAGAAERKPPGVGDATLQELTNRERAVLLLLPTMMSNQEVADELFVSVNTVKVHLKSLYRKLDVGTRRQAVARARELGILLS